ncbi:hypothetical protein BN1184_AA_01240 [Pantoea ananatis]|nr:hypothetical protein BN1184_AA_01240 [Pantoea ananatis]
MSENAPDKLRPCQSKEMGDCKKKTLRQVIDNNIINIKPFGYYTAAV